MGSSACPWADSLLGDDLAVGPMRQKSQQTPPPLVGAAVDVLGHLVVHKGKKLVADDAAGIGDLGHIAGALALVGAAAVPDLVVEDRHRAGWSESGEDLVLVVRAFDWIGRRRTEEVRAWYDLGGALCDLVEIGQHVVAESRTIYLVAKALNKNYVLKEK